VARECFINVVGNENGLEDLHATRALRTYGDIDGENPREKASPGKSSRCWRNRADLRLAFLLAMSFEQW